MKSVMQSVSGTNKVDLIGTSMLPFMKKISLMESSTISKQEHGVKL